MVNLTLLLPILLCASAVYSIQQYPFKFGRSSDGFLGSKFVDDQGAMIEERDDMNPDLSTGYLDQKLDHFSNSDTRMWKQFYWVNKQYYKPGGPAFVLLGGEGPTSRAWIDPTTNITMTWMKMAEKYGAMAFQLEHRYYGKSQPTEDMSTPNLQYLSSKQALADAAYFILNMTDIQNLGSGKWVVFGGSYSGMLSGWFRFRYPGLVVGAIASSAPVQAQVNFKEYLGVVSNSLGAYSYKCLDQIYQATDMIRTMARTNYGRGMLQNKFKLCQPLDQNNIFDMANFYEMFANVYSGAVQYSKDNRLFYAEKYNVPAVCALLENSNMPDLMDRYAAVNDLYMATYGVNCQDISQKNLVDYYRMDQWTTPGTANRLWFYQTCTEFGFYQGSDLGYRQPFGDVFPYALTLQLCKDVFGDVFTENMINTNIMKTNMYFGGRKGFTATNVVLPNGNVDPWHILGVYDSPDPSSPTILMRGTAHVADMYPASPNDPAELTATRKVIEEHIGKWLGV